MDLPSLLHIAARFGQPDITKRLTDAGADIHAFSKTGLKPIHIASINGHFEIVEYYLNIGMNIDECENSGKSMLHLAVAMNDTKLVTFLIDKKANVNLKDKAAATPLKTALDLGFEQVTKLLFNTGSKLPIEDITHIDNIVLTETKQLFIAVKRNSFVEIEKLLKVGNAEINARNNDNSTILHYAAWKGYLESVKVILKFHANPNILGKLGCTPLHYAAKFGHLNIVKELLAIGAIYDLKSQQGNTPLDLCKDHHVKQLLIMVNNAFKLISTNQPSIIDKLHQIKDLRMQQAIVNAHNNQNQTIFILAMQNNFSELFELFGIFQEKGRNFLTGMATTFIETNYTDQTLKLLNSIHEIRTKLFGKESLATLAILKYISRANYLQCKYDRAYKGYTEIFEIQKKLLGDNNKFTIEANVSRASVLVRQSNHEAALNILKDVIERQKTVDVGIQATLEIQNTLGIAYENLEMFDKSLEAFNKVHNINKGLQLGPVDITAQKSLINIAGTLMKMKKYNEALEKYMKAYQYLKATIGEYDVLTLQVQHNIATVYVAEEKFHEALVALQAVLDLQIKHLGPNHIDTIHSKISIATVYFYQKNYVAASKLYAESLPLFKSHHGPFHPFVIEVCKNVEFIKTRMQFLDSEESVLLRQQFASELFTSSADGDVASIKKLLCNGIYVNTIDADGRTALQFAVHYNHMDAVLLLLSKGADPTIQTKKGNTTLHAAAANGSPLMTDILISHVKSENRSKLSEFVNCKTSSGGSTALHVSSKAGCLKTSVQLLMNDAIYDLTNARNETPAKLAASKELKTLFERIDYLFNLKQINPAMVKAKFEEIKSACTIHETIAIIAAQSSQGQQLFEGYDRSF